MIVRRNEPEVDTAELEVGLEFDQLVFLAFPHKAKRSQGDLNPPVLNGSRFIGSVATYLPLQACWVV